MKLTRTSRITALDDNKELWIASEIPTTLLAQSIACVVCGAALKPGTGEKHWRSADQWACGSHVEEAE